MVRFNSPLTQNHDTFLMKQEVEEKKNQDDIDTASAESESDSGPSGSKTKH